MNKIKVRILCRKQQFYCGTFFLTGEASVTFFASPKVSGRSTRVL